MDFAWFKHLSQLDRTGNFSQSAQVSNISQPAFSRRIRAIEEWVGTKLVERGRHPVSLTPAGKQMLEASMQAFERLEYERAQILEAQTRPDKYVVTFGAQHSIGWRFFPAWLQAFEEAYGPIISKLRADNLADCLDALNTGEVDFVIAYESADANPAPEISSVDRLHIGSDRLIPVSKPDSDMKPMFGFEDPNGPLIPWLRFGDDAPISRHIEPLMDRVGIRSRLSMVYENSMAGALRIRARDGAGVAWLPESLVAPDFKAGLLVRTGPEDWTVELDISLLRNQEKRNQLTTDIWTFLSLRQRIPLVRSLSVD